MAGKTLVRPENGRSQRIVKYLADMTRKNHIKIFFKVGYKIAKIVEFKKNFDPPKNKKPSVQKVPPYEIYGDI